jgi:hypothetical protein
MIDKVNLSQKLSLFQDHWSPKEEEVEVLLLEPKTTLNTGSTQSERTVADPDHI